VRMTIACQVVGTPEQHAAKCYFDCLDAPRKESMRCVESSKGMGTLVLSTTWWKSFPFRRMLPGKALGEDALAAIDYAPFMATLSACELQDYRGTPPAL
jgi:hypothetical protein